MEGECLLGNNPLPPPQLQDSIPLSTHSNAAITCSSVGYSLCRLENNTVKATASYDPDFLILVIGREGLGSTGSIALTGFGEHQGDFYKGRETLSVSKWCLWDTRFKILSHRHYLKEGNKAVNCVHCSPFMEKKC